MGSDESGHQDAHRRLWIDVVRRAQPGTWRRPRPCSLWRPGSPVMAQCKLGGPAMGSDSTISRSGHQGPPLPGTDLPQAAGSNISSNVVSGTGSTEFVEDQGQSYRPRPRPMIFFWISVVPKIDWTWLSRQNPQSCRRAADSCSRRLSRCRPSRWSPWPAPAAWRGWG